MTLAPGTRIRNFVLTERIGRGGMGEVWKATLDIVGKPIAVKFILADRLDTKLEARFLKEAMTMARLDHDRIVPLNDFFAVDGVFALVMPYIEGVPLANLIEAAPQGMPLQDAMSISLQILSGLDYAHDIGIVHRDIKSTNVLVTKSGKAWLMDFGISKAMGERGLTQTGTAIGTVSYMSPEQIKFPAKVDRRADIYSFGVMLYEMLTGHLPFDDPAGDSGSAYIVQTAHCIQPPPPLRTWNPDIPQDLEMIVLRSLEKEPDQRYQTCAEFALTLQNYSQNSQNGFRGGLRPEVGADLEKDLSIR
jgi:serine/threonine-protein kinase